LLTNPSPRASFSCCVRGIIRTARNSSQALYRRCAIEMKDPKNQEPLSGKQKKLRDKQEWTEPPGKNPDDLKIYPQPRRLI
jgi:hypothetical protein